LNLPTVIDAASIPIREAGGEVRSADNVSSYVFSTIEILNGWSGAASSTALAAVSYRKSTTRVHASSRMTTAPAVALRPVRYRTFGRCVTTKALTPAARRSDCKIDIRLPDAETAAELMRTEQILAD
jgi:hypothetical protein